MLLRFQSEGNEIVLNVEPEGAGWRVRLPDGTDHRISAHHLPDDILQITETLPGEIPSKRMERIPFARMEQGIAFSRRGHTYLFSPASERRAGSKAKAISGSLTAPMVGVVADVLVTEGQTVEAYQPLVAIEAMKVIATLDAPFAGTIEKVSVEKGQRVEHGAPLVEVVPLEPPPGTKI